MDLKKMVPEKVSKEELTTILKNLKLYKDLTKKLGSRGKELYKNNVENISSYKVEYFSSISKQVAEDESLKVYKMAFKDDVSVSQVKFIENNNIDGGIRVYKDDNMVDISYKKMGEALKK